MHWNLFSETPLPEGKRLYWWRVGARDFGGITARPEFAEPSIYHCDHYTDKKCWLPQCAHWDGYKHIMPDDLEWAYAGEDVTEKTERWPGIDLLPCPFCGGPAEISSCQASLRGGRYTGLFLNGKFFKNNWFKIKHRCGIVSDTGGSSNLKALIAAWNKRHSHLREAA